MKNMILPFRMILQFLWWTLQIFPFGELELGRWFGKIDCRDSEWSLGSVCSLLGAAPLRLQGIQKGYKVGSKGYYSLQLY